MFCFGYFILFYLFIYLVTHKTLYNMNKVVNQIIKLM